MAEVVQHIPAIIGAVGGVVGAIGAIVATYLNYNQHSKNKMTDAKIELWKKQTEIQNSKRMDDVAIIYSELYQLLHTTKVDRIYIVQPHPLINNLYLTISIEVKRKGVSTMIGQVRRMPMGDVAHFVGQLAKEKWLVYNDIETAELDKKARAIMCMNGTSQVYIKRLADDNDRWIGSLFLENTGGNSTNFEDIKGDIAETANNIQYILPEYKDVID